ncbi:MAG: hypothetical protein HKP30_09230 [Myxococcales bacterium]|nr:hypothetical protein [Myxococcales bacterium]
MPDTDRKHEPWPLAVAALLLFMVSTSLAFLGIAIRYPDPPVVDDAYRAGLAYAERMEPLAVPEAPDEAPAGE